MKTKFTQTTVSKLPLNTISWDTEVPGLGIRISPAGVRTFFFQFRVGPRQGKLTIGRYPDWAVEAARKQAREYRVLVDKGEDPQRRSKALLVDNTVGAYAELYLEGYAKRRGLSASTVRDARHVLSRFVLHRYGRRQLSEIKVSDVEEIMDHAKTNAGPAQANRVKATLSRIFTLAIRNEVVTFNPCTAVPNIRIERRFSFMSPDEVAQLLDACDRYPDQIAANAIRLLLFTGARLREVLRSDWSQFDLKKGTWTRPSSHTKTKRSHSIALPAPVMTILLEMRDHDPTGQFLFPGRSGAQPRSDLKRPWAWVLQEAGIGHWRIHDLRRTTASFMLSTGADISAVGKTLGHTQAQTTASYMQLHSGAQQQMLSSAVSAMQGARAGR
ncbi:site-specific integrase [uncultured Brevundimonas sp.]|uniref:tyrosine-type recombinase/integrase n=1 Tax=uncultured Brevundimonas sp. TaxID=213418 RepID=UPI002635EDBF|nr:site-specific integrase [uncultured Brevundimonas sp.]